MTNKLTLLIVDDENPIRRFLNAALRSIYEILEAGTGEEALSVAALKNPDAIILDLGLPDCDGIIVTRRLREWTRVPIIVISVRNKEADKVTALDAGADDYLTKPFNVGELMARLRGSLRHISTNENETIFQSGNLAMDMSRHEVSLNKHPVSLTPTEYDILRFLVQNAGKVLTHKQLMQLVWGNDLQVNSHLLRVNISNLRKKIEANPSRPECIKTEPGIGYRLCEYPV